MTDDLRIYAAGSKNADLKAVAINADTVASAKNCLFKTFMQDSGVSVILLSPEQLESKNLDGWSFTRRLRMMALNEARLLNTWGKSFWKASQQIGWMRACFKERISTAAVTATG